MGLPTSGFCTVRYFIFIGQSLAIGGTEGGWNRQPIEPPSLAPNAYVFDGADYLPATLANMPSAVDPAPTLANQRQYPALSFINRLANYKPTDLFAVSVHAEGGTAYVDMKKGTATYNTAIAHITAAYNNATALGYRFALEGIHSIHGEGDQLNAGYGDDLVEWWSDYSTDAQAVTGQARVPAMFLSQPVVQGISGSVGMVQAARSPHIHLVHPTYQLQPWLGPDGANKPHLTEWNGFWGGELRAEAQKRITIDRQRFTGLNLRDWSYHDNVIEARFWVPTPPLKIDTNARATVSHYGFSVLDEPYPAGGGLDGQPHVTAAAIGWNTVTLTVDEPILPTFELQYGVTEGGYGGQIRDSSIITSDVSAQLGGDWVQHNWMPYLRQLVG